MLNLINPNGSTNVDRSVRLGMSQSPYKLGQIASKYESNGNIADISYDSTGGTSYGKYQIASKVGGLTDFLNWLDSRQPEYARRLRAAGPANTGSRRGAMPDVWKALAAENPEEFEKIQHDYAYNFHFLPAMKMLSNIGFSEDKLNNAIKEMLWSTAIQHGPTGAKKIFTQAHGLSGNPSDANYWANLVNNVYDIRGTKFPSSTEDVRRAVLNRFKKERQDILNLLNN